MLAIGILIVPKVVIIKSVATSDFVYKYIINTNYTRCIVPIV